MPIYEYECNQCHQITEALQKFSDPALSDCPHCQGRLRKLMSLNSFHLKGSGWYVTDYSGRQAATQPNNSTPETSVKDEKASKTKKTDSSTKSSSES